MACVDKLHLNDKGTSIELLMTECNPDGTSSIVDITTALSIIMRFQKSDKAKTTIDKVGVIYTDGTNGDGTDGIIQYITEEGLVDVIGSWKVQAIVSFPNGSLFHSDIESIKISDNLAEPIVIP